MTTASRSTCVGFVPHGAVNAALNEQQRRQALSLRYLSNGGFLGGFLGGHPSEGIQVPIRQRKSDLPRAAREATLLSHLLLPN